MMQDNEDLPIQDATPDDDLPLVMPDQVLKMRPAPLNDMYRGHAAIIKAEIDETDVFSAYDSMDATSDPKTELDQLSYQRSQKEQKGLEEYFERNLGHTPEDVAINVQVYREMLEEENTNAFAVERQVVEAASGVNPDEQAMMVAQAELELVNVMSEISADYTFLEKGLDIVKAFLPTGIIDNKQISDSFFGAEDYLRDVVIGLKDLKRNDPDKFSRILPVFVDVMKEDLPKGKQLGLLMAVLGPRGEEELQDFGALSAAFDVVDIATLGMTAALKVAKVTKLTNAVRLASKLDNSPLATDINVAVLTDVTGEVAKKTGIDKTTAHANAAPFNVSDLDESYAPGISAESRARISQVRDQQKRVTDIIRTQDGLLKEELLTPAERLVAEDTFSDTLRAEGIEDFTVVGRTDTATTFQYRAVDAITGEPRVKGNKPVVTQRTMDLTMDDVTGVWRRTEEGLTAAWLRSPTAFSSWDREISRSAIRMDSTSTTVGALFQRMQADAMKPILGTTKLKALTPKTRRQMAELDDVLISGDEWADAAGTRGKMFTPDELRGGLVNGVRLDDKQIETYYNLRGVYDELWNIRNEEVRKTLVVQGKKNITVGPTSHVGKPMSRPGATAVLNQGGQANVYNAATDEIIQMSGKDVAGLYDEGYTLSRLDSEIRPPSGNHGEDLYDLVLVRDGAVQDLPQKVLTFRPGYVPKVNQGAYWFVKRLGDKTVNGVTRAGVPVKTERMFTSKVEADRWLSELSDDDAKGLQLFFDRELEQQVLGGGSNKLGAGGGLYTGARSSEEILFGVEGTTGTRLNTYEALGQNLSSLENYVTRNQWRMGMQQRWINSAQAAGFKDVTTFDKLLIPERDPRGKGLLKLAEQIEIWSGFPTSSELKWDGFVSGLMEWSLNSRAVPLADKTVVRGANWLRRRENDPANMIRGVAFHSLLGVLNPVQLFVQAQGAAAAMSLSNKPIRAFRLQNALSVSTHLGGDAAATKMMAGMSLVDAKELDALTRLWKKTGLETSVTNTADHIAASRGMGVARESLRKVVDKGLLFYRMGELFNRRYSFIVALEKAQRSGVIGKLEDVTDDQLKTVLSIANDMMFNLSKANKARWQSGVLAIPTQFLQVQAKFIESVVGINKSFTIADRGRLIGGQLALYGAAGVPLGSLGVRFAQETLGLSQKDIEELPEESVAAINSGIWGVVAHSWLGADVDVASRGALASGMMDFTLDLMFSEATIGEKVSGAAGVIPLRGFQAWKNISPMILSDREGDMTKEELMLALRSIASITSTWRSAEKGYFMNRFHRLNDSRNNPVISDHDFNLQTEVMTMIGFQPSELKRVRDRDSLVRANKEYRDKVTDALIDHYWNYVQALNGVESEEQKGRIIQNYKLGTEYLMKSLGNEGESQKVRAAVNARLQNPEDKKTRSIRQYLEEFSEGQVVELGNIVATMRANGLIQNDLEFPEEGDE